jgi:AcrR family transcriptional regulator
MNRADRETQLLDLALVLAEKRGFERVTRQALAREAGVSESLVSAYWTSVALQNRIMQEAVDLRLLTVIAQGLAARHPAALAAPRSVRRAAALSLVGE